MKKENIKKDFKVNDEINSSVIRLVGETVDSKVMPLEEAKAIAFDQELDLVEINSKVTPPIVKLCKYEKLLYELKKNKQPKSLPLKEIHLSVNITLHDIEIKVKKAIEFLSKGHKVKVILTIKGRELTRREESKKSILQFLSMIEDHAIIESLKDESNKCIAILKRK